MTIELGIKNKSRLTVNSINRIVTLMRLKTGLDIRFELLRPSDFWEPKNHIVLDEHEYSNSVEQRIMTVIQEMPDLGLLVKIDPTDYTATINEVADLLARWLFPNALASKGNDYTLRGEATIALTPDAVLNINGNALYSDVTVDGGTVNIADGAVLEKVLFRFGIVNYPSRGTNFVDVEGKDIIVNGVYYDNYTFSESVVQTTEVTKEL